MIKYIIYALLFVFVFSSVIFLWVLSLQSDNITTITQTIAYIPLEFRIVIFMFFIGVIFAIWKGILN